MTVEVILKNESEEEAELRYTQSKRRELVEAITTDGPPIDKHDRLALLAALDGMDRQTQTKMKLKSDERIATNDQEIAQRALEIQERLSQHGVNPFEGRTATGTIPAAQPARLAHIVVADAELVQGVQTETYDEFIDRYEGQKES